MVDFAQGPELKPRNWLADRAREYGMVSLSNRLNDPSSGAGIVADGVGGLVNMLAVQPYQSFQNMLAEPYERGGTDNRFVENAFDVAGATMTGGLAAPRPKGSVGMSGRPKAQPRNVDGLGYYSQLDEVLAGLGPKDKVTAQTLQSKGVKASEIEARGLMPLLSEGQSSPVSGLIETAGRNKVEVREVQRSRDANAAGILDVPLGRSSNVEAGPPRFADYSLDPSNQSYRETVLHLPNNAERGDFKSGHFPEPNIIGHMMTSINRHEGKPVYTIDQIQSDWGQKLRDGIEPQVAAEVAARLQQANVRLEAAVRAFDNAKSKVERETALSEKRAAESNQRLRAAEHAQSQNVKPPGNPFVNTTDQWTNTTLRRGINQAVQSGADYMAIPSGNTVLSYNPGETAGMQAFYDQIVPKNLNNILRKYDPSVAYSRIETLDTPSKGAAGQGFSLFPITDPIRERVRSGQPLFANPYTGIAAPAINNLLAGYGYGSQEEQR